MPLDFLSFVEPKLIPSAILALFGTSLMSLLELPFWRKWGIPGVFEWHENQILVSKIAGRELKSWMSVGIISLHYINGFLAGIFFPVFVWGASYAFGSLNPLFIGVLYALLLWMLTLVPIHKPITGLSPFNHPLGKPPVFVSLAGHMIYGLALSLVLIL